MGRVFAIALRNILEHRRRSLTLGGAIVLVTILLVMLMGVGNGIQTMMFRSATTLVSGHVTVGGFYKFTPTSAAPIITDYKKVRKVLAEKVDGLDYVIDRMRGWGKLISDHSSQYSSIDGIDINEELGFVDVLTIVHGDIKPSNIMLKCTGAAKIIDIGSAFELDDPPACRTCTPAYSAREILEGDVPTPLSDLASLGYVLIELLAGRRLFKEAQTRQQLLVAKRELPTRLHEFVPREVAVNELLMKFCRGLIAADPNRRFPSAEAAELVEFGAADFHRQLIHGNLASEYDSEIRKWLEELRDLEAQLC